MSQSMDQLIEQNKVIICAGTGGVGKTSISAAIGMKAAKLGKRVLVLTIDPARRLKTALGISEKENRNTVSKIDMDSSCAGELYVSMIDAKKVFDEFVIRSSESQEEAAKLLNNLLYKKLSMGLEGSQEFTSLDCFLTAFESGKYDLIVLDTPPSQHAIDFLQAPAKLSKLFDERILKFFISESQAKSSFLKKWIQTGSRKAFSVLEALTGKQFVDEIFSFFIAMKGIRQELVARTKKVDTLLHSEDVAFVLVTAYDARKISQAYDFSKKLDQMGFNLSAVVVNRVFRSISEREVLNMNANIQAYYSSMLSYHKKEEDSYKDTIDQMGDGLLVIKLFEVIQINDALEVVKILSENLREQDQ